MRSLTGTQESWKRHTMQRKIRVLSGVYHPIWVQALRMKVDCEKRSWPKGGSRDVQGQTSHKAREIFDCVT